MPKPGWFGQCFGDSMSQEYEEVELIPCMISQTHPAMCRKKRILLVHTFMHTPIINLAFGTAGSHNSSAMVCVGGVAVALNQCKLIAMALCVLPWHHPHTSSLRTKNCELCKTLEITDPSHLLECSVIFGFIKIYVEPKKN